MPDSSDERRGLRRSLRHLACEVEIDGDCHKAVILNLSVRGVFARTNAKAPLGASAIVRVRRPGGEVWELETEVARFNPPRQGNSPTRGLGLEIICAPPGFEEFLASLSA